MSAISETEPGGEMVCILGFSARPRDSDHELIPGERRTFRVGERVRYLASFSKGTPEDNPTGLMAVFAPIDPKDKKCYAATQHYFASLDCWEGLEAYFAKTRVVTNGDLIIERPDEGTYLLVEVKKASSRAVR